VDLEAVETALKAASLAKGARALEALLSNVGVGRRGYPVQCTCGQRMVSRGVKAKTLLTVLGKVRFDRSLFQCPRCRKTRFPGDEELGVVDTTWSPGVQRLVARFAVKEPFEAAADDLRASAGIAVSPKDMERIGQRLDQEIRQCDERTRCAQRQRVDTGETVGPACDTLYVELDGTGIPMVPAAVAGRKDKQADGTAKTREAKLGCITPGAPSCLPTGPNGSKTRSTCTFPAPFTSSISTTPASTLPGWRNGSSPAIRIKSRPMNNIRGNCSSRDRRAKSCAKRATSRPDAATPTTTSRTKSAIWTRARTACAMTNIGPRIYSSVPASSKRDARTSSANASNSPACSGPSAAPTPYSPCDAASSPIASRISGNTAPPPDLSLGPPHKTHYPDAYPDIVRAGAEGSTCWFTLWGPGKFYPAHNDFSYNIGRDTFREIFLPVIQRQTEFLDYTVYHVDGIEAFRHVDALCELPRLQAIQILPGTGKPSPLHYMDTLSKVQAARKNLHIRIAADKVQHALAHLSARGLFIDTSARSEDEARDLLRMAERWSVDRG